MVTSNKSDISDYSLREILNNAKGNRCGGLKQKAARGKLDFAPVFLHRTYIRVVENSIVQLTKLLQSTISMKRKLMEIHFSTTLLSKIDL
ncbi:hypothetical protein LEP1GSC042_0780 [Leptospira kirschneri serovar Bim str. PUO 1247]|nr:hypothetical protein LEP1GSC042_0780 [Leptospira kirschneri serovar Bim str. PUO 1247]